MKNSFKAALLLCAAAVSGLTACNDAEYSTLGARAFINESLSSSSRSQKVTITNDGVYAEVTVCVSEAAPADLTYKFEIDPSVLDEYNAAQSSSFIVLPESGYEMDATVTIEAGKYAAPATRIFIKPLADELIGESYAIPLRIVPVKGGVPAMPLTGAHTILTEAITVSTLPQFNCGWSGSGAGLTVKNLTPINLPQFTVECRFQVSNTSNRNRSVFTNGNGVLLRFEDPQADQNGVPAHSLVQFQGDGWYLNPTDYFRKNKWQHLALTYDGTAVRLYVNGAFAGTKEGYNKPEFNGIAWFGGDAGGGHGTGDASWWAGCKVLCSELRIWNYARSADQVQNNMTTVSARSEGLVAYWRMNEGQGRTFTDCTANGYVLEAGIDPIWVSGISSDATETPWQE